MKKALYSAWLCLSFTALFFSCATAPIGDGNSQEEPHSSAWDLYGGIPERPVKPPVPELIMGQGVIMPEDLTAFLLSNNPSADKAFVENLAIFYIEEGAIEGVNHDVAFAQMCIETGFLRYGGLVTPDMNNFCGLGSAGSTERGEVFPTPRIGVRAHIQHLKAYATSAPLNLELVDPRYRFVRLGSAPFINDLSGTWAADRTYGGKISNMLERLYSFSFD